MFGIVLPNSYPPPLPARLQYFTLKKEGHILDDSYLCVQCHKGLNRYLTQVKLEFYRHIFYEFYSEQKSN